MGLPIKNKVTLAKSYLDLSPDLSVNDEKEIANEAHDKLTIVIYDINNKLWELQNVDQYSLPDESYWSDYDIPPDGIYNTIVNEGMQVTTHEDLIKLIRDLITEFSRLTADNDLVRFFKYIEARYNLIVSTAKFELAVLPYSSNSENENEHKDKFAFNMLHQIIGTTYVAIPIKLTLDEAWKIYSFYSDQYTGGFKPVQVPIRCLDGIYSGYLDINYLSLAHYPQYDRNVPRYVYLTLTNELQNFNTGLNLTYVNDTDIIIQFMRDRTSYKHVSASADSDYNQRLSNCYFNGRLNSENYHLISALLDFDNKSFDTNQAYRISNTYSIAVSPVGIIIGDNSNDLPAYIFSANPKFKIEIATDVLTVLNYLLSPKFDLEYTIAEQPQPIENVPHNTFKPFANTIFELAIGRNMWEYSRIVTLGGNVIQLKPISDSEVEINIYNQNNTYGELITCHAKLKFNKGV